MNHKRPSAACWPLVLLLAMCGLMHSRAAAAARPTILAAQVFPAAVPPGSAVKIIYTWDGVPMDKNYSIFVHVLNAAGAMVDSDDHNTPWRVETSTWWGRIAYTRYLRVPPTPGTYRLVAGLHGREEGHQPLNAGDGVTALANNEFQIGTFKVDPDAPPPPLDCAKPKTLDLSGYRLTFDDEFQDLSVANPHGSLLDGKHRWVAGDASGTFGDAEFVAPQPGFPFRVENGMLNIIARKDIKGHWQSGILYSNDDKGNGFSQQYGYFAMRAKMPPGPGIWPAFWLNRKTGFKGPGDPDLSNFEIDILEMDGLYPQGMNCTYHWWYKTKPQRCFENRFRVDDMTNDFHTYGLLWDEHEMVMYFDGVELWRYPTPPEANAPFYILLDLALFEGQTDRTPNPSVMQIKYVRVYAKQ